MFKTFLDRLIVYALLVAAIVLAYSTSPLENFARAGDFVGGIFGTVIAGLSVYLLVETLKHQRSSSEQQSFENRYFELVKLHRENVAEFDLGKHQGRKTFISLVREFQAILQHVSSGGESNTLNERTKILIAYYTFYYGVGPNSSRMLSSALEPHLTSEQMEFVRTLIHYFFDKGIRLEMAKEVRLSHGPVDGHQSRLGHYYRHLYQTVSYIDQQEISDEKKRQYVKTIRAQLTNYEQALLLINSLTPLGEAWEESNFMRKYRMVRNLPKDFFDKETELDVLAIFENDPHYFEWQDQAS
ncbi:Uncharacterized conserved protein [Janthinobacterium sp. Marseille]|nr:Uncharacterized conserved protein [Janthinobacterium sp. Marseille]